LFSDSFKDRAVSTLRGRKRSTDQSSCDSNKGELYALSLRH